MGAWARRNSLAVFFGLAALLSWLPALPLIASAQGWTESRPPLSLHYLTAYGPMLAAVLVAAFLEGGPSLQELLGRITRWRVGIGWLLVAIFSMFGLFALSALIARATGSSWPDLRGLGQVNYLPYLGAATWVLWLLNSGLGEEAGWRGFALPRLQRGRSALAAALILGLIWSLWHIPFFFYLDDYMKMGLGMYPLFALGVISGSVIFTWLFNSTGGSALMAILMHASLNTVTATAAAEGTIAMIESILVMVWAVVIVLAYQPSDLATLRGWLARSRSSGGAQAVSR